MIRRIKPVSRSSNKETEVRRTSGSGPGRRAGLPEPGEVTLPPVDIIERKDEILLEMELPGVLEKEIKILLYSSKVEISGQKRESPRISGAQFHRLEREYGAFRREIFVPRAIDPEKTCAYLANGVLTIVLKKPPATSRDVDIRGPRGE
jgi:HSP20 family protein